MSRDSETRRGPVDDLTWRPALIFGGGRGLGRPVALAIAREHARVAVAVRTASEVEAVAREVRAAGAEASRGLIADARRERDVEDAFSALAEWGPPVLVLNTVDESFVKHRQRSHLTQAVDAPFDVNEPRDQRPLAL